MTSLHKKRRLSVCLVLSLLAAPPLVSWVISRGWRNPFAIVSLEVPALFRQKHDNGQTHLLTSNSTPTVVLPRVSQRPSLSLKETETGAPRHVRRSPYPLTLHSPYALNSPDLCRGANPLHLLILVHTATTHFQRRSRIRETWAGKDLMKTRNQRVLFLLGLTRDDSTQREIEKELQEHGDLVQGRFMDTYHNLTHKGVMGLRWVHEHCPHARLILKMDDDVFFNPFLFYHAYYSKFRSRNRTIACMVRRVGRSFIQRTRGKWTVPEFQFRGFKYFPVVHCNGFFVLVTPDIIKALYWAAHTTPFLWLDDVYMFGLLPAKVGNIEHVNIVSLLAYNGLLAPQQYTHANGSFLGAMVYKHATFYDMWRLTMAHIPPSLRSEVEPKYLTT